MASAREFCRIPGYPVTIFFTYSFDPLFFERIPWADLEVGGSRRIVIAADVDQVAEAMRRCAGQIVYLGRRYVLAETNAAKVFHPKLIARLSEEGGRVWIGSGNLTYTGWGGNRELAASWAIGPDEDDKGAWLDEVIEVVGRSISSVTFFDQLRDIRAEIPWLTRQDGISRSAPVLLGRQGLPLGPQLAERWRGRRFDEVRICTGSTDVDGAFLAWAQRTFGIKRAIVCLSPAHASFDPIRLANLPLDVKIVVAPPEQLMHAKFYWFSGKDGPAAIVGSANCSAAAWLAQNVEIVVPYDEPKEGEFEPILALFKGTAHQPSKVLTANAAKTDTTASETPSHRLVSLRLHSSEFIEALIEPPVLDDADVYLVFRDGDGSEPIKLVRRSRGWSGRLALNFQVGPMALFAHAQGISGAVPFETEMRWVDDERRLGRATSPAAMDTGLSNLSRRRFSARDDQRILETIQAVAAQLLEPGQHASGNASTHPESSGPTGNDGDEKGDQTLEPVDPLALIRSLADISRKTHQPLRGYGAHVGNTLSGVIALLFGQEGTAEVDEEVDLKRETWSEKDPVETLDDPVPQKMDPPAADTEQKSNSLEASKSFRRELDQFLVELAKPSFAATCAAEQMVQALAFPLLLCIRGAEAHWLPKSLLTDVAVRVTDVMFNKRYGPEGPRGLFRTVGDRYAAAGKQDEFESAAGDGTLWLALLAALAIDPADPWRSVLPQASALSSVFHCRELLSRSDASRLSSLLGRMEIQNAQTHVIQRVEAITQAISMLISTLTTSWDVLSREQRSLRSLQPANALLWNVNWGWNVTADSPAETSRSGFINVEDAADDHPEIKLGIERVYQACRTHLEGRSEEQGDASEGAAVI